jgi:hypothetical protein
MLPGVEMNVEAVMKSPIIALPVLMQIAMIAGLYYAATSVPSPTPPSSKTLPQILQLQQQRDQIETKLAALETRELFLPRGMGRSADVALPSSASAANGSEDSGPDPAPK